MRSYCSGRWFQLSDDADFVFNIRGHLLSDDDTVVILDTCASDLLIPRISEGVNERSLDGSRARFSIGDATLFSPSGGEYRLCWCSGAWGSSRCNDVDHFAMDIDRLAVMGLALDRHGTCVRGMKCSWDGIMGYHL